MHDMTRGARTRHDGFTILLHWLTAGLVTVQFLSAELWGYFPHPEKRFLIIMHMSLGVTLLAVLLLRILWRLIPGHALHDDATGLSALAAKAMHYLLYTLLAAQMPLGFFTAWTKNRPLDVFGLLVGSPIGPCSKTTAYVVDQIHDINAWVIMGLAAAHALVALAHHFWWRDDVLRRMLPARPRQS